jgi:hypothetical protein
VQVRCARGCSYACVAVSGQLLSQLMLFVPHKLPWLAE